MDLFKTFVRTYCLNFHFYCIPCVMNFWVHKDQRNIIDIQSNLVRFKELCSYFAHYRGLNRNPSCQDLCFYWCDVTWLSTSVLYLINGRNIHYNWSNVNFSRFCKFRPEAYTEGGGWHVFCPPFQLGIPLGICHLLEVNLPPPPENSIDSPFND